MSEGRIPCGPCSRIQDGRTPAAATYRWWTHEGRYHTDLCESCSGWWLIGALEENDLTPVRIEPLDWSRSVEEA